MGPLSQKIDLRLNNGTGFDAAIQVDAHVSKYREQDLVDNGSIRIGDLKIVILYSSLPGGMRDLELKDRIEIDARAYSIIKWDTNTRSVGDTPIAVEVTVRG